MFFKKNFVISNDTTILITGLFNSLNGQNVKKCIFSTFGTKFHHQRSPDPQFVGTIDIFLTLPLAAIEEAGSDYDRLVQIAIQIDTDLN